MKIACVVGAFPEVSTTFILDHITGLLDRGHDVHVFARLPESGMPVHADFHEYNLADRVHYWWGTPELWRQTRSQTARLLRANPRKHAAVIARAFDPFRFGTKAFSGRFWAYATALLASGPFDVVLAQFGTNGQLAQSLRATGAFEAPIATTWLGYDLTRIIREHGPGYYRELFAHGDLMLPLSEYFRARLIELGCPPHKLRIQHLGVDASRFEFKPRAPTPGERVRIVTVCRLVEKKGLGYALRALARVAAAGHGFEYHLVGDGPMRAQLEQLRDELQLQGVTTFHGARNRDEVRAILDRSHLFLSPSITAADGDQEGTPVAIMEAMAAGLPVISTLHSGIPEVIEDGVSGFLVPERDVEQLADRIARLIAEPELWPQIGRAARSAIETRFDVDSLNDQLAALLTELASR